MFELKKIFHFEAGHSLAHHQGLCHQPHGHSYTLTVCLRSKNLSDSGPQKNMVIDYHSIKVAVEPILKEYLDHQWLNKSLKTDSPTAEFIAQWVYHHLKSLLPSLYSITVAETASSSATYWE